MTLKFSDLADKVNDEVKDGGLKKILFRTDDPESDDIKGIGVLYRMLILTFIASYAKYKYDLQHGNVKSETPNAKRVFESFSCVFNGENIGLDLIIYVLTEMQLDVLYNDKRSYFKNIFSANEDAIQIPTFRGLIKTWLHSAKHAEKDNAKLASYFYGLYIALDILRNMSIVKKDDGKYYFKFKGYSEDVPSYNLIKIGEEDNEFYYLSSYENVVGNCSRLSYVSLDGGEVVTVDLPFREFISSSAISNNAVAPKTLFAKSLFSIGFKYIKNLSLSVSDVITKSTKQKFYEHYSRKYVEVFEQLGYRKFADVNWDNVITILMFEEGPSELLEFILDSDGIYFDKILNNLEIRYNSAGFARKMKEIYEKTQTEQMGLVCKYIDEQSSIVKNIITINKTIMTKTIIDGLAELEKNKKHSNSQFVESLPMRITSIDKVIASNEPIESKIIKINKALEKTFRYVIPFYYGIIAYQTYKEQAFADREAQHLKKGQNDSASITDESIFVACEDIFYETAKKKSEQLRTLPLGKLVEEFRSFAISLSEKKDHKTVVHPNGRILKDAIGRSYFCSVESFNDIINMRGEDFFVDPNEKDYNLISVINSTKHQKNNEKNISMSTFNRFLLNVKKLLYFLMYNEDYQREMILGQQIFYDPIYPYVVRYTERSENRDGYNINGFSVFFAEDSGEKEVKILSEREYIINEKYYCIPNVSTSNSRWWIEPFLISCRKYDAIISGEE